MSKPIGFHGIFEQPGPVACFSKVPIVFGPISGATTGLEIATNTVAFATKFLPLRLKYLEKSQICDLLSTSLFRNKRVSSCHFAATFAKISK